jgi:hypothetical protein
MQSQYGFPSQAAAPALEYAGVSSPLTKTETIAVFVMYAIANISASHTQETSCLPFLLRMH